MATVLKTGRPQPTLAHEVQAEKIARWDGMATGVFTLWYKHMRKFVRSPMELGGTLATPVLWMLLFGVCMDSALKDLKDTTLTSLGYQAYIAPGVMLLTGLTAAVLGGATLLIERVNGVIKEYLVAPVPRLSVLLGTLASGLTKALVQAGVVLLLGVLLDTRLTTNAAFWLAGLGIVAVYCLGFVGVAAGFASRARSMESYHTLIMVMNLPVLFLSNALYPLAGMPWAIRWIALLNPTTYAVDATRHLLYRAQPEIGLAIDLPVLVAFMLFGLWYGYRNFQRSVANPI